jgi:hypothetical protein
LKRSAISWTTPEANLKQEFALVYLGDNLKNMDNRVRKNDQEWKENTKGCIMYY